MKIELQNMMERISEGQSASIMTYGDALMKAAPVLASDPQTSHRVLQAYLSYLPVDKKNGQYEFRPHWNFLITYDNTGGKGAPVPWARMLRVDALSGQVFWM